MAVEEILRPTRERDDCAETLLFPCCETHALMSLASVTTAPHTPNQPFCWEFAFAPAAPWTVRPGIGVGELGGLNRRDGGTEKPAADGSGVLGSGVEFDMTGTPPAAKRGRQAKNSKNKPRRLGNANASGENVT